MSKKKDYDKEIEFSSLELEFFEKLASQRDFPNFSFLQQKKHAETMLSLHRPVLYRCYEKYKEGLSLAEIARDLKAGKTTVKRHLIHSIFWLKHALGGDT